MRAMKRGCYTCQSSVEVCERQLVSVGGLSNVLLMRPSALLWSATIKATSICQFKQAYTSLAVRLSATPPSTFLLTRAPSLLSIRTPAVVLPALDHLVHVLGPQAPQDVLAVGQVVLGGAALRLLLRVGDAGRQVARHQPLARHRRRRRDEDAQVGVGGGAGPGGCREEEVCYLDGWMEGGRESAP